MTEMQSDFHVFRGCGWMLVARYAFFSALILGMASIFVRQCGSADEPAAATRDQPAVLSISSPESRVEITADELEKLPHASVAIPVDQGAHVSYEGVPLAELLKLVGVKLGAELRGRALARYALVEAADGYRVVFSLPELDQDATGRNVLLADRRDGKALDAKEGPLRIVIPDEKRHSRWVRQVTAIHVHEAPSATKLQDE
jgi:hypothetical protein